MHHRIVIIMLLTGRGNQAAGRFLILSYFYGFLILRTEQVAGTYCVARRQVEDSRKALGDAYMFAHVCFCICVCMHMYMCVHVYRNV